MFGGTVTAPYGATFFARRGRLGLVRRSGAFMCRLRRVLLGLGMMVSAIAALVRADCRILCWWWMDNGAGNYQIWMWMAGIDVIIEDRRRL